MYRAPLKELNFVLTELVGIAPIASCPRHSEYSSDLVSAVLEEAGRFAEGVLEPLYRAGDREGSKWTPDGVRAPPGWKAAYQQFAAGGWPSLRADPEYGGQGMPLVLSTAVEEIWAGANLAFKLCPMLTQGAIEALQHAGSAELKSRFLPRMVSGEWSGTMNLTEPQAGSDLAAVKTRAVREGGRYRLYGQKIFITWGDHDLTENLIHLVLARVDGAPAGVRGLSMFVVPKVNVADDGSLEAGNDVTCLSIEEKLGIHASPTCVLAYGQQDGAVGYLVGEENRGLEYMFVMMNAARLSVGLEGYAMSERAYQQAAEFARTRVQGRPANWDSREPATIVHHADVRRMLLTMKSQTEAMRALGLYAAAVLDFAESHPEADARRRYQARGDLLIPIVKGWSTETGIEIASLGMQVHGGMGYVEETGAAQILRDVRICTIYEGTTGIQSNDLVGRKLARDGGSAFAELLAEMRADLATLEDRDPVVAVAARGVAAAVERMAAAGAAVLAAMGSAPERGLAVSVPFLRLCGIVAGGWLLAKSAGIAAERLAAGSEDAGFMAGKLASANFYVHHILPQAVALATVVEHGAASVVETDEQLALSQPKS